VAKVATALEKLAALFAGSEKAHGTHGAPERDPDGLKWSIKRTARTLPGEATLEMWSDHVKGDTALGVIPIRGDSKVRWGSIDFDQYDVNLLALVEKVEKAKFPLVPCRSKSGGLHLFVFLEDWEPAGDLIVVLKEMAASLGMAQCEIFPKQVELHKDRKDVGNWMVMPYFGDTFEGKLKTQVGLKRSGAEMMLSEFVGKCEASITTTQKLVETAVKRREPPKKTSKKANGNHGVEFRGDFTDGPVCLEHLGQEKQSDGRKRMLFHAAVYYKKGDSKDWKTRVEQYNQNAFVTPLPADEVTSVQKSLEKKDYEYTCKAEPMCSHCNVGLCRTRKFGVGRVGDYPEIGGIRKIMQVPPKWFVDVNGYSVEVTTEQLQQFGRFHAACMASRGNLVFSLMKQEAWIGILQDAMQKVQEVEVPDNELPINVFRDGLREFLTNRRKAQRREDLLDGKPWLDEEGGVYVFSTKDLLTFFRKNGYKQFSDTDTVSTFLEEIGAGRKEVNFNNKHKRNCRTVREMEIEPQHVSLLPAPKQEPM
jgi:hypothetical protein